MQIIWEKEISFYDIKDKKQVTSYLDTKVKDLEEDPDKRWIATWNYYLVHIKRFFRWLHNHKCKGNISEDISESECITPPFINIGKRRLFNAYSKEIIHNRFVSLIFRKLEMKKTFKIILKIIYYSKL